MSPVHVRDHPSHPSSTASPAKGLSGFSTVQPTCRTNNWVSFGDQVKEVEELKRQMEVCLKDLAEAIRSEKFVLAKHLKSRRDFLKYSTPFYQSLKQRPHCGVTVTKQVLINTTKNQSAKKSQGLASRLQPLPIHSATSPAYYGGPPGSMDSYSHSRLGSDSSSTDSDNGGLAWSFLFSGLAAHPSSWWFPFMKVGRRTRGGVFVVVGVDNFFERHMQRIWSFTLPSPK